MDSTAAREWAFRWCEQDLAEHPGHRYAACTVDPDADPVAVAVVMREKGRALTHVDKAGYDELKLFQRILASDLP